MSASQSFGKVPSDLSSCALANTKACMRSSRIAEASIAHRRAVSDGSAWRGGGGQRHPGVLSSQSAYPAAETHYRGIIAKSLGFKNILRENVPLHRGRSVSDGHGKPVTQHPKRHTFNELTEVRRHGDEYSREGDVRHPQSAAFRSAYGIAGSFATMEKDAGSDYRTFLWNSRSVSAVRLRALLKKVYRVCAA